MNNYAMAELEAEVKRQLAFITEGEMRKAIEEHSPHYVIGWLSQSIKYIADRLEKAKEIEKARELADAEC